MDRLDVVVVGGGVIGLSVGWRMAAAGRRVAVLERGRAGRGATYAAGGMLAPAAEIGFEEFDPYALGRESVRRWPAFAREVERASGRDIGYRDDGTLVVADDRDRAEALRRLFRFQQEQGVPAEWLSGAEAREREPMLSPRLAGAIWVPEDHQVDNRALADALAVAFQRAGGVLREETPVRAVVPDAAAPAVVLGDGSRVEARAVVLAAGAWTRGLGGLDPQPPIRPVKGQALALALDDAFALRHVVRGRDAYLVPKADRLVVGATSEERGWDRRVTAGGVFQLLEGARRVVPGVDELELVETWAGPRPASRDHQPLIGFGAAPGVAWATGHFRHGVLLAPITADAVAAAVAARLGSLPRAGAGGAADPLETDPLLAPFSPRRFSL